MVSTETVGDEVDDIPSSLPLHANPKHPTPEPLESSTPNSRILNSEPYTFVQERVFFKKWRRGGERLEGAEGSAEAESREARSQVGGEGHVPLCLLRLGFQVPGFGFCVSGFGFRVSGFRFRVSGFGFRVSGFGFRVAGFELRVSGFGFCLLRLVHVAVGEPPCATERPPEVISLPTDYSCVTFIQKAQVTRPPQVISLPTGHPTSLSAEESDTGVPPS